MSELSGIPVVRKCPDCRSVFGCLDRVRTLCDIDCTTKDGCEIIANAKVSELEICSSCLDKRLRQKRLATSES